MKCLFGSILILVSVTTIFAQNNPVTPGGGSVIGQDTTRTVITTAVPFLTISPDTRAAAMGDAGVATSADANSSYWNPGKLAFIDKQVGFTLSYSPWLARIVNDMSLSYLSGFYKINKQQVVSASIKYFNMGEIEFRNGNNVSQGSYNPREYAFDVTYSRMLTEHFGLGGTLRYIHSNLTGAISSYADARAGNSVAVDLGAFYTKEYERHNSSLSLGGSITNLGSKMTYTDPANKDFIPTNLRIGGAYKTHLDAMNTLTFVLDFNKLMVPSNANERSKPLLSGVFGSFTDASFSRQVKYISFSPGAEYWYRDFFALRAGYHFESFDAGNRKYFTAGVGFRTSFGLEDQFGLDMAYMIPATVGQYALAETIRFTIFYILPQKKAEQNKSVTDN